MTRLCDKCGKPVEPVNDVIYFEYILQTGHLPDSDDLPFLLMSPRHLLRVGDCCGSPSRAQYLENQPRDSRPEYPYRPEWEEAMRKAYNELQELLKKGNNE